MESQCGVQGLLEIISAASEFDDLAVRPGEENLVQRLLKHAKFGVSNLDYTNPHTKVNALIQVRLRVTPAGRYAEAVLVPQEVLFGFCTCSARCLAVMSYRGSDVCS